MTRKLIGWGLVAMLAGPLAAQGGGVASRAALEAALPIYFVENRGVYPEEVAYYVIGREKSIFFAADGLTFSLRGKDRRWAVKLAFLEARSRVTPVGEDPQEALFSYFKGRPKDWRTGLPTFARIRYPELWPGIDLVYSAVKQRLKYEFHVQPGADPGRIRLRYSGARRVEVTAGGGLRVETPAGTFEDGAPIAHQEVAGRRVPVAVRWVLLDDGKGGKAGRTLGLEVGEYDRTKRLILDPVVLVYCGYIGGSGLEGSGGIAVDRAGNVYIAGGTTSTEASFPVTVGPDLTHNGGPWYNPYDVFVAKMNAAGTGLIYCGYIGGSNSDYAAGIAVDSAGSVMVCGTTLSREASFPVTVGPDLTYNGGPFGFGDAFVAKLDASGTRLLYCGYIGGSDMDECHGIAVDGGGNAYVTGVTRSTEATFPVTVGPDLTHNGGSDGFVAKVDPNGMLLAYCGYVGGIWSDSGADLAVDGSGSAYVAGYTFSDESTFPVTVGPDTTYNDTKGGGDAFVARIVPTGTSLAYCGYIGGDDYDEAEGVAVDSVGNLYVTGSTNSSETTFPVTVGPFVKRPGTLPAFVARVQAGGRGLDYCGYLGGASGGTAGLGVAIDAVGNAYVVGVTNADETTFPVRGGPDLTFNGVRDAFVAKVNAAGTALDYAGYIGGASFDAASSVAVDAWGDAYVAGNTMSDETTFPVTVGPDLTYNGDRFDVFVARVALDALIAPTGGTTAPGGRLEMRLRAVNDAGLPYQAGSSLGLGPIPIDTRKLRLALDALLVVSVSGAWPGVFGGYRGVLDGQGEARAIIAIPTDRRLVGVAIHTAFVTASPSAPSGIKSISNTFSFVVTSS